MKVVAVFAVVVLLAALGGVGWLYLNATVTVTALDTQAVAAQDQLSLYRDLQSQVEEGRVIGTAYTQETPGDASEYQLIRYTLRIDNATAVPMEAVEVSITPQAGDVLQVGDLSYKTLGTRSQGDISAMILTGIDSHSVREAVVSWYMWGLPFSQRVTCGR